jgi:hypothetical protein
MIDVHETVSTTPEFQMNKSIKIYFTLQQAPSTMKVEGPFHCYVDWS